MSTQELVSIREYARRRGVSDAAVRKWIRAGRIVLVNGKVDPVAADQSAAANRSGTQQTKLIESTEPEAVHTSAPDPGKGSLAQAQRQLTNAKAEKAELELAKMRGEMVPAADVELVYSELVATAKSRLLLVPDKLAEQVAAERDPIACRNMMEHAIREALEELATAA